MKKTILKTAIAATLGAVVAMPAQAAVSNFNYDGFFTMLDPAGAALANSSLTAKGANQYQTAISGTMSFDTTTGAGTGTLVPFQFFGGDPTLPAEAVGINMQSIGDGMGGAGSLVLGNMLFNYNGTFGIPVSIVLDAAGFFNGDLAGGGAGAVPASDGTYTNATVGYLGLGPVPIATTEWNTTNSIACGSVAGTGACLNVGASGVLPLIADVTPNGNEFAQGDGFGIGGSPFQDGPFTGFNANFDIGAMTFTSQDAGGSIAAFDVGPEVSAVPIPAAAWLFGSGLLGLVGVARRKKSNV